MNWISDDAIGRLRQAAQTPDLTDSSYRLLERVARGGMGVVWLAQDTRLQRRVALKVLDVADDSGTLEARLLREARILAQLEHPGIVPVHDVGHLADGRVFYTMKYVQGARLDKHLRDVPGLPDRLRIVQRICEAVAFAHSRGVLHRDLKPENIMVGPFGELLVMDWGVAKVLQGRAKKARPEREAGPAGAQDFPLVPPAASEDTDTQDDGMKGTRPTAHGAVLGTPGYMAPEQARGDVGNLDERADVYSLGGILRFMLTGQPPEEPSTLAQSGGTHPASSTSGPGKPLPQLPNRLPRPLRAIVAKSMSHDREARYATASALAADVGRYLDGLPVEAYPEGPLQKARRLYGRHKIAFWLIFTYLLVRGLIVVFLGR
jgi:serine/threonine protein kinase